MTITVKYGAQIRDAAGTLEECVAIKEGCTLRELFTDLAARHGMSFRDLLLDTAGNVRRSNMILLGDEMVRASDSRVLEDKAVVTLLSPIAGG
ncbi:MAG TPA: MoaD/ThiS family protein [Planctomycetota bacterium]|jgi:molybdopterin converting factor small subunit